MIIREDLNSTRIFSPSSSPSVHVGILAKDLPLVSVSIEYVFISPGDGGVGPGFPGVKSPSSACILSLNISSSHLMCPNLSIFLSMVLTVETGITCLPFFFSLVLFFTSS
mgnify:CR=1 FL=1